VPVRLGEILFGDPLAISDGDLAASAALVLAGGGALLAGHRTLLVAGFDPASSRSLGVSPSLAELLLTGLLAATVLVAVQALGNLLVVAIVVAPAAAALRLAGRLGPAIATAAALAVASGVAGIYLSFHADVAAGASIAVCALAIYLLAALIARIRTSPSGGRRVRRGGRARPAGHLPASPATDAGAAAS
jgi:ABC-type Mn2+/Zn2+ transport system permease subunit